MNIVIQLRQTNWVIKKMAAQAGLEPATNWLTVNHSTNWVTGQNVHIRKTPHQPRGSRITTTECGVYFLTMPSLTNTVAGTLTLPLKETICIVLSFDFSTLQRRRLMHSVLHKLQCLSGLFPLSDPWHSSHRRHIGRLRLNSVSLNLIP